MRFAILYTRQVGNALRDFVDSRVFIGIFFSFNIRGRHFF